MKNMFTEPFVCLFFSKVIRSTELKMTFRYEVALKNSKQFCMFLKCIFYFQKMKDDMVMDFKKNEMFTID